MNKSLHQNKNVDIFMMAKAHMVFRPGELKSSNYEIYLFFWALLCQKQHS